MSAEAVDAIPAGVESIVNAVRNLCAGDEKLPSERELARLLDVKRHQLRKALDYLRRIGELDTPAARRQNVSQANFNERLVHMSSPIEVIEMRLIIEPGLARLASLRASPREIERISQAATTPADADAAAVDREFHEAVASAARNDLGVEIFQTVRNVGSDARLCIDVPYDGKPDKRIKRRDREHQRVAEAIAHRDPDAAERAMLDHLQMVSRRVQERSTLSRSNAA